jgi:MFS family permease
MSSLYFATAAITGPVAGIVAGGIVFSKLGGYENPKTYPIATIVMAAGCITGFPLPWVDDIIVAFALIWFEFFCGGFSMPVLLAIMINSVPPSGRTTANSVANFFYNLLGYLPAPYVYGVVYDLTGGGKSIWGLFAL